MQKLHTNGVPAIFNQMAKLNLLPLDVHFNKTSTATIIPFSDICDIDSIRVLFNLNLGIHFDIILPTGKTFRSKRINSKLFYFGTAVDSSFVTKLPAPTKDNNKSKHSVIGYSSLQNVNENKYFLHASRHKVGRPRKGHTGYHNVSQRPKFQELREKKLYQQYESYHERHRQGK